MTSSAEQTSPENRPLSGDRPIETAIQDRLGYAPFARAIAASIVKRAPSEGIVYAIHGPWGSGKTSAVNLLIEAVGEMEARKDADHRIIVVRFNPWWFSEQSDLTKMFFSELASTLDKKATKKIAEGLRKVGRQLTGSKDLLAGLFGLVPGVGAASPIVKAGLEALGPHLSENDSLDSARQDLIDAIKEQGRRILVIIDDVDRLPADEIKQIFRLVKSVADLPHVVHLLVFDRVVASRAVGEPVTAEGPEWLEKIVQASFDLPPVHPVDLRQMLADGINELIADRDAGNSPRDVKIFFECVFPWIKTPRDVGRLLNALNVSLPIVIDDVDISDFVAVETLRTFEPDLYHFVRDHANQLTGIPDTRMRESGEIGKEILATVRSSRVEQAKSALKNLFPRLQAVWDNQFYDGGFAKKWDRARLICIPRHFPSYFSFALGDDALSSFETSVVLQSLRTVEGFSAEVRRLTSQKRRNGTTKAALVFDAIQSRNDEFSDEEAAVAARTLLNVGPLLSAHHDRGSGFAEFPFTWNYWFTLSPLLMRVPAEDRLPALLDALHRAPSLVALTFVITALEGEHGLHDGGRLLPPEQRTVDEAGLKQLQDNLRSRIQSMAADGSLLRQADLSQLLFRWQEAAGSDAVRAWSTTVINDDGAALRLAEAVLTRGSTQGFGDYVATTYFRLNREDASRYVDVDALAQRLREIEANTAGGVELARQFLKAHEAKGRFDNLPDE